WPEDGGFPGVAPRNPVGLRRGSDPVCAWFQCKERSVWIVVPLILLMSWRTCRSLGQAISETAAWAAGYLGTAGVIVIANWGNIDIIRDRPDSPGSALAILGGFVGMGISRYLWKRRGGHLNRKPNRWLQAA